MPINLKKESTPEERIAKHLAAIREDLEKIDKLDNFGAEFRAWVKREVARLEWRYPNLLK